MLQREFNQISNKAIYPFYEYSNLASKAVESCPWWTYHNNYAIVNLLIPTQVFKEAKMKTKLPNSSNTGFISPSKSFKIEEEHLISVKPYDDKVIFNPNFKKLQAGSMELASMEPMVLRNMNKSLSEVKSIGDLETKTINTSQQDTTDRFSIDSQNNLNNVHISSFEIEQCINSARINRNTNAEILDEAQGRQVQTFYKIYYALRETEKGFFKTDWVAKNKIKTLDYWDAYALINEHANKKPGSRTQKAWELAQKHDSNCKATNKEFLDEGYLYAFKNSGIFKVSTSLGKTFFRASSLKKYIETHKDAHIEPKAKSRYAKFARKFSE